MLAYFNRFEISLTKEQASSCSHQGDCSEDVRALIRYNKSIARQLDKLSPDDIRAELKEYGAWDTEELADDEKNRERILWIAAGNISEEMKAKKSN
jgi:hypothetical protein